MNHVMRKCVLCHMQTTKAQISLRIRAVWSWESDQRLCCSLPRQNDTSSLYIRNFKCLAGLCGCEGRFVSEDTFCGSCIFFHNFQLRYNPSVKVICLIPRIFHCLILRVSLPKLPPVIPGDINYTPTQPTKHLLTFRIAQWSILSHFGHILS